MAPLAAVVRKMVAGKAAADCPDHQPAGSAEHGMADQPAGRSPGDSSGCLVEAQAIVAVMIMMAMVSLCLRRNGQRRRGKHGGNDAEGSLLHRWIPADFPVIC